jgi:hypothetical protein
MLGLEFAGQLSDFLEPDMPRRISFGSGSRLGQFQFSFDRIFVRLVDAQNHYILSATPNLNRDGCWHRRSRLERARVAGICVKLLRLLMCTSTAQSVVLFVRFQIGCVRNVLFAQAASQSEGLNLILYGFASQIFGFLRHCCIISLFARPPPRSTNKCLTTNRRDLAEDDTATGPIRDSTED